jgi:formate-dependent phosphoribosylglycinamide formyltransferase (GAR transformylase)
VDDERLPRGRVPERARIVVRVIRIGPPFTVEAVRLVLLGSGELGREVAIEAIRLGCEVVAVDRYADAPAMQVAHRVGRQRRPDRRERKQLRSHVRSLSRLAKMFYVD